MASAFDTQATSAFSGVFLSTHGATVTYTARGASSGTSITAGPRELPAEEGSRRRRYWCLASVVTSPVVGDQITDSTEVWVVYEVGRVRGGLVPLDAEITADRG